MTTAAERIREQHRGARLAAPASQSRLAALNTFGLRYVHVDEFNVIVEGEYHLNLAMSFWRANDNSAQGYLVSALNAEIRGKQISEKPAAGRDSVPAELEATELHQHAESAAGTTSSSLLPVVSL